MTTDKKGKKTKDVKIDEELEEEVATVEEAAEEQKEQTPEEQVKALTESLIEAEDKILRLQAEYQNYRKRAAKDISNARMFGLTETIVPFLQVFDHFSMAVKAAESSDNMDAIRQGLEMILGEYGKALEELGVQKFDAVGQAFDPDLHEAMARETSDEVEEGNVIKQWSCGYKMGERLLRPAMVVVSSGPAEGVEEENQD
jgi:molecular chaperone GrpE